VVYYRVFRSGHRIIRCRNSLEKLGARRRCICSASGRDSISVQALSLIIVSVMLVEKEK
jgi:hypothetical protein